MTTPFSNEPTLAPLPTNDGATITVNATTTASAENNSTANNSNNNKPVLEVKRILTRRSLQQQGAGGAVPPGSGSPLTTTAPSPIAGAEASALTTTTVSIEPNAGSSSLFSGGAVDNSENSPTVPPPPVIKTLEEREEEYARARERIFNTGQEDESGQPTEPSSGGTESTSAVAAASIPSESRASRRYELSPEEIHEYKRSSVPYARGGGAASGATTGLPPQLSPLPQLGTGAIPPNVAVFPFQPPTPVVLRPTTAAAASGLAGGSVPLPSFPQFLGPPYPLLSPAEMANVFRHYQILMPAFTFSTMTMTCGPAEAVSTAATAVAAAAAAMSPMMLQQQNQLGQLAHPAPPSAMLLSPFAAVGGSAIGTSGSTGPPPPPPPGAPISVGIRPPPPPTSVGAGQPPYGGGMNPLAAFALHGSAAVTPVLPTGAPGMATPPPYVPLGALVTAAPGPMTMAPLAYPYPNVSAVAAAPAAVGFASMSPYYPNPAPPAAPSSRPYGLGQ